MAAPCLPAGLDLEELLTLLRRLCWESAAILRAYARGVQPPFGYGEALSVDEGGEGPVTAADLAQPIKLSAGKKRHALVVLAG